MKTSLLEMFGTRADITWKSSTTGEVGTFELDGQKFEIIYDEWESLKLHQNSSGDIVEVGFSRIENNKPTIRLTNNRYSIKVFSIIFNGIIDKFQKSNFPMTILFSAKKGESYESRVSLYSRLQDRVSRFGYDKVLPIENNQGAHFILTKAKLTSEDFSKLKEKILKL